MLLGRILLSLPYFFLQLLFLLLPLSTLPVFCESRVTNHSGTDVWDAGWRQRCAAGFRCESYACGYHHIYHISYVNIAGVELHVKLLFSKWCVVVAIFERKGERLSQQHKDHLQIFIWTNILGTACYFWLFVGLLSNKQFLPAAWMRSVCSAEGANLALSKCSDLFTHSSSCTIRWSTRL